MSDVQREDVTPTMRERIARLARIWDEESLESAEEFADAMLADLGIVECGACEGRGVCNGVECEVCRTTGLEQFGRHNAGGPS